MNKEQENQLRNELKACKSLQSMLYVLTQNFELNNCKPNMLVKGELIDGLIKGMKICKAKPKERLQV